MESYPRAAVERAMKVQEVIMRAMAKKITWAQAGEIIGLCERQMRRWKERYEEFGYDGEAREQHHTRLSYTWVKRALQMAQALPTGGREEKYGGIWGQSRRH